MWKRIKMALKVLFDKNFEPAKSYEKQNYQGEQETVTIKTDETKTEPIISVLDDEQQEQKQVPFLSRCQRKTKSSQPNHEPMILAKISEKHLNLKTPLGDEFFYQSLPICVIDTVYSLNQVYKATQNVVSRFCKYMNIKKYRSPRDRFPMRDEQYSINNFIDLHKLHSFNVLAEQIYKNRRPTSPKSGILRSEAIHRFSIVLQEHGVNFMQDTIKVIGERSFESAIQSIPGQHSGVSLRYFYMLAGSEDYLKPDVWLIRFVEEFIGKKTSVEKCEQLLLGAAAILKEKYTDLTPRRYDYAIWHWQHNR